LFDTWTLGKQGMLASLGRSAARHAISDQLRPRAQSFKAAVSVFGFWGRFRCLARRHPQIRNVAICRRIANLVSGSADAKVHPALHIADSIIDS
jgi:hypothetical protein